MKKLVLLTLAATVVAGSAFAAAPVTKISDGSTKVQADYAFKQHVSNGGGNSNDGFGVSLQHDLSNKAALQYSYDKLNAKNGDIKDHQLALVYKVHPNVNLYGAGTAIRKQTYQVGAQYEVRPDVDLNVYYGYDKYSVDSNDKTAKGLHAGVGYSF